MSTYQQEQLEAVEMVRSHLHSMPASDRRLLTDLTVEYRAYRQEVNAFLKSYLAGVCTQKCYQSRLSACCSREGIITFFADVVINTLVSSTEQIRALIHALQMPNRGYKCIYLGPDGCRWQLKPIVCELFICEPAQQQVFDPAPEIRKEWEALKLKKKHFTWPDKPVIFDSIETLFIKAGYSSPLMYMHNSPGLLRVKQRAGLKHPETIQKIR
ncbi:MAG: hypothetical protein PVF09_03745 [Desulfobacterales bacterium]|jgi:hypothetical protein|nr:hypothetical protein [Deltaproteobacteria bacterium]